MRLQHPCVVGAAVRAGVVHKVEGCKTHLAAVVAQHLRGEEGRGVHAGLRVQGSGFRVVAQHLGSRHKGGG